MLAKLTATEVPQYLAAAVNSFTEMDRETRKVIVDTFLLYINSLSTTNEVKIIAANIANCL